VVVVVIRICGGKWVERVISIRWPGPSIHPSMGIVIIVESIDDSSSGGSGSANNSNHRHLSIMTRLEGALDAPPIKSNRHHVCKRASSFLFFYTYLRDEWAGGGSSSKGTIRCQ